MWIRLHNGRIVNKKTCDGIFEIIGDAGKVVGYEAWYGERVVVFMGELSDGESITKVLGDAT